MRYFKHCRYVLAACLAAMAACAASPAAHSQSLTPPPQAAPAAPAWTSDPAQAAQLSAAYTLDQAGTIQPPKGFSLQEKDSGDGAGKVYQWTGPAGVKGSTPTLSVIIAVPPSGQGGQYSVDQVTAALVGSFRADKANWKLSTVSIGSVHGLTVHRVDWSGLDTARKLNIDGVVFGAQLVNGSFLLIAAEDAEPDSSTYLPLLIASALTFSAK